MLQVSQEAFNETVKENIEELGMSPNEAVDDTVKQFQSQGADLSYIVKELALSHTMDFSHLTDQLQTLKTNDNLSTTDLLTVLKDFQTECEKGMQYKVAAGQQGAYNVLINILNVNKLNTEITISVIHSLTVLMSKQPDLLDETGVKLIIDLLKSQSDESLLRHILKWTKVCCIMQEKKQTNVFQCQYFNHLKPLLITKEVVGSGLLRDILGVLRAFVLDDDIRVEFGNAHEHARVIASDTLCTITALMTHFKHDEAVINDIMLTLAALIVRAEFCKKVADAGGISVILEALVSFRSNDKIVRQGLKLLKGLAGNDECKVLIISGCNLDAPCIIKSALSEHIDNHQTCVIGLGCIAALSLRSPSNSAALYNAGIVSVIIAAMTAHQSAESVQQNASWAIRNMVSRSRDQCKAFLELGAEQILKDNLQKFPQCQFDTKSALRDLGCTVDLKEEWTGKGGKLNTGNKTMQA